MVFIRILDMFTKLQKNGVKKNVLHHSIKHLDK